MTTQRQENQGPIENFRFKNIQVTVWPRDRHDGGVFHEIETTRSYKDKNGEWQKTHLLTDDQMLIAHSLQRDAIKLIQSLKKQDRTAQNSRQQAQTGPVQQEDQYWDRQRLAQEQQRVMDNAPEHRRSSPAPDYSPEP